MNTQQIMRNMASNYARFAFGVAAALLLTPLIVSKLGLEALGLWALTNTVAGYFSLTDLGITPAAIKYISHYRATQQWENLNKTISTSLSCFCLLSLLSLAAGFSLSLVAPTFFHLPGNLVEPARLLMLIVGLVAALGFFTVIPIQCAIASQRQDLLNSRMLIVQVINSIASLVCVYKGYGIVPLGLIQLFSTLCNGVTGYSIAKKYLPEAKFQIRWDKDHGKLIGSFAGCALVMTISSRVIYFTDSLVIGHYLPMVAVGAYAIGLKIIEFMRSMVGCGAGVLGTFVSEQSALGQTGSLRQIWIEGTKWSLAVTLPLGLLCALCGSHLISSWVGTSCSFSGLSVGLLAIGLTADLSQSTSYQILVNGGKQKALATVFALEAAANLALSILLIKQFGLVGVALGTLAPQLLRVIFFITVLMPRMTSIKINEYLRAAVIPAFAASSLSALFVVVYRFCNLHTGIASILTLGALSAVAQLAGVYCFCLSKEQRLSIARKLGGIGVRGNSPPAVATRSRTEKQLVKSESSK